MQNVNDQEKDMWYKAFGCVKQNRKIEKTVIKDMSTLETLRKITQPSREDQKISGLNRISSKNQKERKIQNDLDEYRVKVRREIFNSRSKALDKERKLESLVD